MKRSANLFYGTSEAQFVLYKTQIETRTCLKNGCRRANGGIGVRNPCNYPSVICYNWIVLAIWRDV